MEIFNTAFKASYLSLGQILLLAVTGYFFVRRNLIGTVGIETISRLVIDLALPCLIFSQIIKDFSFALYPSWWGFPLISVLVTGAGLLSAMSVSPFIKGKDTKQQFLSIVAFQNAAYLPLALISALLPQDKAEVMLIYLFLYILGFNLVIWSLGVFMLSSGKSRKFELAGFLNPPVIAICLSLALVALGANRFLPEVILSPIHMTGECTLPLALFVVGANLAEIKLRRSDSSPLFLAMFLKMILLPALGLLLLIKLQLPELLGLLIIMQLSMPPATSLSVIIRRYRQPDILISQGVFWGHMLSIITIPLFISLYFLLVMVK